MRINCLYCLLFVFVFSGCTAKKDFAKKPPVIAKKMLHLMQSKYMRASHPVLIRIFKQEKKLEVWKQNYFGHFVLLQTYPICNYSGQLGPKFYEGDKQSPEGFYTLRFSQLNPYSRYHLSFNIGFPNLYDSLNQRTGKHLMIHGGCKSVGCYAMTDEKMEEIYALVYQALKFGQQEIQIQIFPFRMTNTNIIQYKENPHYAFWQNIKEGYDYFERKKVPPIVRLCEKEYFFDDHIQESVSPCSLPKSSFIFVERR